MGVCMARRMGIQRMAVALALSAGPGSGPVPSQLHAGGPPEATAGWILPPQKENESSRWHGVQRVTNPGVQKVLIWIKPVEGNIAQANPPGIARTTFIGEVLELKAQVIGGKTNEVSWSAPGISGLWPAKPDRACFVTPPMDFLPWPRLGLITAKSVENPSKSSTITLSFEPQAYLEPPQILNRTTGLHAGEELPLEAKSSTT